MCIIYYIFHIFIFNRLVLIINFYSLLLIITLLILYFFLQLNFFNIINFI